MNASSGSKLNLSIHDWKHCATSTAESKPPGNDKRTEGKIFDLIYCAIIIYKKCILNKNDKMN